MAVGETFFAERWWKHGRPAEFWVNYQSQIERYRDKWGLRALDQRHLHAPMGVMTLDVPELEKAAARRAPRPRPFPGGLRFAHFHVGDDIYALDRKQWAEFSETVVADFKEKLSEAGTVSFRQALEMGEVMSELG